MKTLGCLLKVKQSHKWWITPTTPKTREFHNLLSKWMLFKEYASEYWMQQPFSSLYILLDAAITATNSPNPVITVWRTATQFENHRLRLFMSRIVQTEPRRLDIETVDGTNCYSNSSSRQFKINLKFQLAIQRAFTFHLHFASAFIHFTVRKWMWNCKLDYLHIWERFSSITKCPNNKYFPALAKTHGRDFIA